MAARAIELHGGQVVTDACQPWYLGNAQVAGLGRCLGARPRSAKARTSFGGPTQAF